MKAFRDRVEAGDFAGLGDLLADDVVFRSPVAFKPYEGKPIVAAILRGVSRVFEDFRYVDQVDPSTGSGTGTSVLIFRTRVGETSVHGADFLHVNDDGLVDELTVMVRPLSAAHALADAMGAQFDRIQTEAAAALTGDQ